MLHAITVKKLPATNTKDDRLVASCPGKRVVLPWSYELEHEANYAKAAKLLALKLGWQGNFHAGVVSNGDYIFVLSQEPSFRL